MLPALSDNTIGVYPVGPNGKEVFLLDSMSKVMKHHQEVGVKKLFGRLVNNAGCILADAMGLGKTVQSIAVIDCFMRLPNWQVRFVVVTKNQ